MIELTHEQEQRILEAGNGEPVRVHAPHSRETFVLVPVAVYERLERLLDKDLPDAGALMNEVMAADDANDPYLESYQELARKAK